MKIDEQYITTRMTGYALIDHHHIAAVSNTNFFSWEADLISVTKSGYIHEFEVKIDKADYKRDFKKKKHKILFGDRGYYWSPNYFWYVIYGFEVDKDSLPENYGLIILEDNKNCVMNLSANTVQEAKLLHREKIDQKQIVKLCTAMSWRILNANRARYGWS